MTAATADPVSGQRGFASSLIHRQLDSYPETGARIFYLAIVVLATITLYYELYVGGSVSTLILTHFGMTFKFYVLTLAFGNLLGAFGSLFAGLTDRYGRANLVVFGLLFAAIFVEFILPIAPNKWAFVGEGFVVGIVEGICLVATPALIRDFSPQLGRATAMGFWTTGPVMGSLIVAIVGSITIPANPALTFWSHEYRICGWVGLIVTLVALLFLRELSPGLRDQLMVSLRDRALIEMRAKGLDIEAALKNHWRQLMKADIIISSVAVSVMLLIYYALVGFLVIYTTSIFLYSLNEANNLGYWAWAFNAGAVVMVGLLSDRFRVRKPFMVIGGIGAAVLIVLFLEQSKVGAHPHFATIAALLAILLFFLGVAYTPWMASFTETVEHRNPAAIAAGLAIWGWVIRVIIFASFLFIPVVINSVTPIVNYGTTLSQITTKYPVLDWAATHPSVVASAQKYSVQLGNAVKFAPELAVLQANPAVFSKLATYPNPATAPAKLIDQAIAAAGGGAKGLGILTTIGANETAIEGVIAAAPQLTALKPYATELTALQKVPATDSTYFATYGPQYASAAAVSPGQWRTWFWVCFGGIIFFLLTIPLLRGRWRPRDAKRDEEEHEAMVQAELARMSGAAAT
jgi:MFS family permease